MGEIAAILTRWQLDAGRVRWHALWLLAQGWSASKVGALLARDPHTVGAWLAACDRDGPAALTLEQTGGPPALAPEVQAELKAAVQAAPSAAGIALAHWNWKAVRRFGEGRCGLRRCRSACTRYLYRLGCVCKRPKKRRLKADEAQRAAFVADYAALLAAARATGARIFFADAAHFRADGARRGKRALKGQPALVDSSCPRRGEQARYYAAVCLETGRSSTWT